MHKHSKPNAAKKQIVKQFAQLVEDYPIIGCVNMQNLPASQLQVLRSKLRDTVVLRMTKRRLMRIALEKAGAKAGSGDDKLSHHLKGIQTERWPAARWRRRRRGSRGSVSKFIYRYRQSKFVYINIAITTYIWYS